MGMSLALSDNALSLSIVARGVPLCTIRLHVLDPGRSGPSGSDTAALFFRDGIIDVHLKPGDSLQATIELSGHGLFLGVHLNSELTCESLKTLLPRVQDSLQEILTRGRASRRSVVFFWTDAMRTEVLHVSPES